MSPIDLNQLQAISGELAARIAQIRSALIGVRFRLSDPELVLYPFLDYLHLLIQPPEDPMGSRPTVMLKDSGIQEVDCEDPVVFLLWDEDRCVFSSFSDHYYLGRFPGLRPENLAPPHEGLVFRHEQQLGLSIHRLDSQNLVDVLDEPRELAGSTIQSRLLIPDVVSMLIAGLTLSTRAHFPLMRKGGGDLSSPLIDQEIHLGASLHSSPEYWTLIEDSIRWRSEKSPPDTRLILPQTVLDYTRDILPYLDGFRSLLDEVFSEIFNSNTGGQDGYEDKPNLCNLFSVVRTFRDNQDRFTDDGTVKGFPYTAGVLLSQKQIEILRAWFDRPPVDGGVSLRDERSSAQQILETPLGPDERSVFDTVISSGLVDFGRRAKGADDRKLWDYSKVESDARGELESSIYPSGSLYYVPIHVNGIPWVAFYTFSPIDAGDDTEHERRWMHNFCFYRDLIQPTSILIRERAEEIYVDLVVDEVVSRLGRLSINGLAEINGKWDQLSRVYPFPRLELLKGRASTFIARDFQFELGGVTFGLTCEHNPYFGPPILSAGDRHDSVFGEVARRINEGITNLRFAFEHGFKSMAGLIMHELNRHFAEHITDLRDRQTKFNPRQLRQYVREVSWGDDKTKSDFERQFEQLLQFSGLPTRTLHVARSKVVWYFYLVARQKRWEKLEVLSLRDGINAALNQLPEEKTVGLRLSQPTNSVWRSLLKMPERFFEHTLVAALNNSLSYRLENTAVEVSVAIKADGLSLSWRNFANRSDLENVESWVSMRDSDSTIPGEAVQGLALSDWVVQNLFGRPIEYTIDDSGKDPSLTCSLFIPRNTDLASDDYFFELRD